MAAYGWRKTVPVRQALFEEGHAFGFFQAVRLLETLYPDRVPPGEGLEPEREVVRFKSRVGLDFPASEVDRVDEAGLDEPAEMVVSILGLAGVQGPLPSDVTQTLLDRSFQKDHAFRDFLDLFNHRLLSLLYRARKKHRPALDHRPPDQGRLARCLFALMGLGFPELRERTAAPDRMLLPYVGLLLPHPRSMVGLERLLEDALGVPVEVVPFRGRWLVLEPEDRTRLGRPGRGANNALGVSAVVGGRAWDQAAAFEVRVGPVGLPELLDLLPIGRAHKLLRALARFYVDGQLAVDVRLTCHPEEIPELRLGTSGDTRLGWSLRLEKQSSDTALPRLGHAGGARLGWTTWLGGPGGPGGDAPGTVSLREVS